MFVAVESPRDFGHLNRLPTNQWTADTDDVPHIQWQSEGRGPGKHELSMC